MMHINLINKIIKKTRRWHKKTRLSFFQRTASYFEKKKKEIIHHVIDQLNIPFDPEGQGTNREQSKIIWICWFQGLDSAPELVKHCIDSVHNNNGDLEVVIITDSNFPDYVSLPSGIIDKYNSGLIGKAHFSDILRCCLLHKYGGIWLDATIFLTRELSPSFSNTSFCSLRFKNSADYSSVSNGFWTTYLLASEKNGYLIGHVMDLLIKYWQKYDVAIDYFLMDYIFNYLFERNPMARKIILAQPELGQERFLLKNNLNNRYSSELIAKFEQDKIGIYKLSYKQKYRLSENGQPTLYSKILDGSFRLP